MPREGGGRTSPPFSSPHCSSSMLYRPWLCACGHRAHAPSPCSIRALAQRGGDPQLWGDDPQDGAFLQSRLLNHTAAAHSSAGFLGNQVAMLASFASCRTCTEMGYTGLSGSHLFPANVTFPSLLSAGPQGPAGLKQVVPSGPRVQKASPSPGCGSTCARLAPSAPLGPETSSSKLGPP